MRSPATISVALILLFLTPFASAAPEYQIFDIGVVEMGDTASQGFGVSPGGIAVGRSFRTGATQAFTWTQGGGIVGLPSLAGRSFCLSNSANDSGIVVGTGATTSFGSGRLPVVWQNGVVSQLPLPPGETLGDANDVNASGVAVGSAGGGSLQRGVIYSGGNATVITQTTPGGSFFVTAFGINNAGRIVGQGIDPNNAARNVGIVYDIGDKAAFEVDALSGFNGALAFGVSNAGHVVGASMLNQGSGLPFIWFEGEGSFAIPLPTGTSQGSARAVNSAGWVVGTASSAFAIPFLYIGSATYRLADLIPPGTGWDLSMNTSSSALGISENGIIVGTGVFNGATHAYAMVPAALEAVAADSRKTHGKAGPFDIPLPLTGNPGVECRAGSTPGAHTFVVTFSQPVVSGSASVTTGTGTVSGTPFFDENTMAIQLTSVSDVQTITVTLSSVTDSFGQVLPPTTVSAKMLIGDTNQNSAVNASDLGQTKAQSGTTTTSANFKTDVNLSGSISASDISQVKASTGHTLP